MFVVRHGWKFTNNRLKHNKVTERQVQLMRVEYKRDQAQGIKLIDTVKRLATQYNIGHSTVRSILNRDSWANVPDLDLAE